MKMIKKEFGMIREHKIILATLIGIMFIPFLYSSYNDMCHKVLMYQCL